MENPLWKMMINNAKAYLRDPERKNEGGAIIDAFQISEVLAVVTGKTKEDIILELTQD